MPNISFDLQVLIDRILIISILTDDVADLYRWMSFGQSRSVKKPQSLPPLFVVHFSGLSVGETRLKYFGALVND